MVFPGHVQTLFFNNFIYATEFKSVLSELY